MAEGADLYDPATLPAGDEGMTEMVVYPHPATRKVIQRFARPMLFVAYDPPNVVPVAKMMIDIAVGLGAHVMIQTPKRKITEQNRAVLITRVGHIIRTQLEQGKNPAVMARNVVDTILSAID